jgi:hypothetical protein
VVFEDGDVTVACVVVSLEACEAVGERAVGVSAYLRGHSEGFFLRWKVLRGIEL